MTYILDESPSGNTYRITSTRQDGTPICLIGRSEDRGEQLPRGKWSQPAELEALRGTVRTNGGQVHAVIHQEHQTIQLIGYASETEAIRAALSLRGIGAG